MTTPERIRRRQRRETALVLVTIVLASGSVVYSVQRNGEQDRCVAEQVTELTEALNSRAELTQRQTEATADVIDSFARAASRPQDSDREGIIGALENYSKVKAEVAELREKTPFPPFPTGKCD